MKGIFHKSQVDVNYCWLLLREYTILDTAQIYTLLRKEGDISNKKKRRQIEKILKSRQSVQKLTFDDRSYFTVYPESRPEGRYKEQITCFWVLLDYISQVEQHYAMGTFFQIAMQIGDTDYNIGYVEKGCERLCMANMEAGGESKYILVVEEEDQIPFIHGDNIAVFATLDEQNKIQYYKYGG